MLLAFTFLALAGRTAALSLNCQDTRVYTRGSLQASNLIGEDYRHGQQGRNIPHHPSSPQISATGSAHLILIMELNMAEQDDNLAVRPTIPVMSQQRQTAADVAYAPQEAKGCGPCIHE